MPRANPIRGVILAVLVAGFIFGVVKLFLLRFESGDVYPAYSSLRSDPLGSRAFYSSLENMHDARVSRNYRPLPDLTFKDRTAFFYIGAATFDLRSVPAQWLEVFERLTNSGGRLVLSFLPVEKQPSGWRMSSCLQPKEEIKDPKKNRRQGRQKDPGNSSNNEENKPSADPGSGVPDKSADCVSLQEKWGLRLAFAAKPSDRATHVGNDAARTHAKGLPPIISWHTALYFDELEDTWRVIYAADGRPVMIERPYGKGQLVISADSFFLSNEALRSERYPQLLTWAIGENPTVVFDETHFGIFKHPGVLSLIQKYRFHWFIFTVAVLALLFIWKHSVYFVPPPKNSGFGTQPEPAPERDSIQGLISLLRRHIPVRQLLQTCAREWQRSFPPAKRFQNHKLEQLRSALQFSEPSSSKSGDPVAGYRRISKIIQKGRHYE